MTNGWMLPNEVMNWINDNIPEGSIILEFGSGQGSIALSSRFQLISVEHDENWLDISAGKYIHAKIVENPISSIYGQIGWYDSKNLVNLPLFADVIIVDGPPGNIGRIGLLHHLDLIPSSNYWIIDDTDREPESLLLKELTSVLDFKDQIEIISSTRRGNGRPRKSTILISR